MNTRKIDARVKRGETESRGSRQAIVNEQRPENDGGRSDVDYDRMLRDEFVQSALPNVAPIPGWHLCWVPQNSSYDPLHRRIRLGYVPVQADELKGGDDLSDYRIKSGKLEGAVACNEMVLMKIPEAKYQSIMRMFHHTQPLQEENAIYERVQELKQTAGKRGQKLVQEEGRGFSSLAGDDEDDEDVSAAPASARPTPTF